ncbi:MAG: hypothetical protein KUA37_02020 [Desulfomicrobium sp.]|nr:hypothetical protein [Pseudomonadota bacterium]MBV1710768.1 hypothetical protein [Desulfomicrobium sp.]MBU4570376.1 hypothetical protein [Pseudomonadota bacterium]MBU4593297.1 hypothetical protein [Pseudomonadota bacterium]MBV1721559.1 hypothetical protein [Desulfomicrobium sp.]
MGKILSSSPDNIRYNGTGRAYAQEEGAPGWEDLGEIDSFNFNTSISTTKLPTKRQASRATILEVEDEREATLSFTLLEETPHNLDMAEIGSGWNDDNQLPGYSDLREIAAVPDKYVELGFYDVHLHRISHGTVTGGTFQVGETVTIGTSTARIVWAGNGYVEVVNPSGALPGSGVMTGGMSDAEATVSGSARLEDVCVVDAASPTKRYVQGADYTLDPDYGMLRVLSEGSMSGNPHVAHSHPAITRQYNWMFSGGTKNYRIKFVTDKDDRGKRHVITFNKVNAKQDGDKVMIGDGVSGTPITGTVLADTSKPGGQEYYKREIM